ncbi:MAG: tRNA lysidine(34) synthetase TilS [Anaerolineae bacterium]|nr:tRNA lysidine(34) synthetase TilS [Anaerolineae bacterium]
MQLAEDFLSVFVHECAGDSQGLYLVCVSGGMDSVVLLDLVVGCEIPCIVAHFNHQLRPSANKEEAFVRSLAQTYQLPALVAGCDVKTVAVEKKTGLEETARQLRYDFFFQQARNNGCMGILTAHHADDQVETVMMHLLRGAGIDGLGGMAYHGILPGWDSKIPVLRPLLGVWRDEINEYALTQGLGYIEDESNTDTRFFRNRLRHEVLPYLDQVSPGVKKRIWQTAAIAAGTRSITQMVTTQDWQLCEGGQIGGVIQMSTARFRSLPVYRQRNLLREVLRLAMPQQRDIGFGVVDRLIAFLENPSERKVYTIDDQHSARIDGRHCFLGNSRQIEDHLKLAHPQWNQDTFLIKVTCQGVLNLSNGYQISWELLDYPDVPSGFRDQYNPEEAWLDAAVFDGAILLRHFVPGDAMAPLGMEGRTAKISDLLINHKIPRPVRECYPVITSKDGVICWLPGIRQAEYGKITGRTRHTLHLVISNNDGSG